MQRRRRKYKQAAFCQERQTEDHRDPIADTGQGNTCDETEQAPHEHQRANGLKTPWSFLSRRSLHDRVSLRLEQARAGFDEKQRAGTEQRHSEHKRLRPFFHRFTWEHNGPAHE